MGDFQRALYDFAAAIRISKDKGEEPSTMALHYNFAGVQLYELGQLEDALLHYELATGLDRENGCAWYNMGLCKSRLGRIKEAIADYDEAVKQLAAQPASDPDYVYQARFNKGICYRRLGHEHIQASIDDLKKAVEMKADSASAHNNLGLSFFEQGNFDEALLSYGHAIRLEPTAFHHNNKGLAHYHRGDLEEAKKDFDAALAAEADATIYFNRGNVYLNWKVKDDKADRWLPAPDFESAQYDYDCALQVLDEALIRRDASKL
jgi:tetratricopeptide (TPR) repeat protein